jgi:hypothetical protein
VFLTERGSAQEIATALGQVIDATVDDIRIHPLCATCDVFGPPPRAEGARGRPACGVPGDMSGLAIVA